MLECKVDIFAGNLKTLLNLFTFILLTQWNYTNLLKMYKRASFNYNFIKPC